VGNGSTGFKALTDGTELAGFLAAFVPDTGLQYSCRQHIFGVELCDMAVGHAISCGQIEEPRPLWKLHICKELTVLQHTRVARRIGDPN